MRLRQHRITQSEGIYNIGLSRTASHMRTCTVLSICLCFVVAGSYRVARPTTALVINEDTYSFGVVTYESNGVVEFVEGESLQTLWPGIYCCHNKYKGILQK